MKSLEKHNKEHRNSYSIINKPCPNGIECPKCKKELLDTEPINILTSNPPQNHVHCPACGYSGYRIA